MVAILYPRRLRELLDVDQPGGTGLPDQGVPVLHSSNSSFVIQTIAGGGGGSFSLGASNLGNTLGQTGVTGSRVVLAGIGNLTLSQLTDANGGTISISGGTAGAGFSAGVSGGNTAGDTGATGTRLVLAGGNNITLSQATDANGGTVTVSGAATAAQSVQTQNRFNLTLSGNTAGALQEVSSGTLTLAGGNGITLSQAGNAITISGAAAGGAQTAISGIAASNTTYTSGTVTITGVGGGVTVSSNTGQRIDISVAAPVAQTGTQFSAGISGGNTSGHSGTVAGRVVLAGGNNITLSGSTNGVSETITVSAAAQTNQAGSLYAIGNTTSSSSGTYDARTLSISGAGIISVAATNSGFKISATESVQTQNLHNVTLSGNTSGAMAQISSGTMTLAGGNNITLSQAGNAVTISGPNVGGAQTGISALANSETTYTSGSVTFSALGALTIRSTTGQHFQFSVNSQTAQTQNLHNVTLSGNTAGVMAQISSGTLTLAGGANITLSQAGNAVTISGGGGSSSDTDVTAINQAGHGLAVGDVVRLSGTSYVKAQADSEANAEVVGVVSAVADVDNFTLTTGGLITGLSGLTAGVIHYLSPSSAGALTTTEPTTIGQISKPVLIARSTTSGYVFNMRGAVVPTTATSYYLAGVSNVGNTAGNTGITGSRLVLAGTNGITLSQSTNASGGTVSISGITQSVQPGVQQIVASNASFSSGTVSISGFGDITVNTAANIIRISGPVQTNDSGGVYAVGNTYSSSSGTFDVRTLSLRGDGIISIAATNSGFRISASQSVQAETQTFVGGIAASNTTYTSGTITITGVGGGVTVSSNTGQRVDISVAAPVAQTNQAGSLYAIGNTTSSTSGTYDARTLSISGAGMVSVAATNSGWKISATQSVVTLSGNTAGAMAALSSGTMTLAGGNNITLSQAGNAITISGGAGGGFSAGVSTGGNTGGATGVTGTRLVFVGSNNVTLSQTTDANGGTVSLFGQAPAGGAFSGGASNLGNTAGATGITGTQLVLVGTNAISLSQTTGANGGTLSIDAPATSSLVGTNGISISTNGSTISIMQTTASAYLTSMAPYDESPMVTGQQGQGSLHLTPVRFPEGVQFDRVLLGIQNSNATNSSNSFTFSQWFGLYTKNVSTLSLLASTSISTNFTGSGTVGSYSLYAGPAWQSIGWTTTIPEGDYYAGIIHRTTTGGGAGHSLSQLLLSKYTNSGWSGILGAATATSAQRLLGQGHYSATTSAFPASIHFSQIVGTGSIVLRSPIWAVRSGTV